MKKLVSFFGDQSDVFVKLNREAEEYARTKDIEFVWRPQLPFDEEDVISQLQEADAGLIDVQPYGEPIFSRIGERCKLLIRFGVGFDAVDLKAASAHGIAITRTTGANKTSVAEMALTQILALRRQLFLNRRVIESGVWEKNIAYEMVGKKVGILGFGNIGVCLAKRLSGFECEILAYDPYPNQKAADELGVRFTDMDEIFRTCDAISVHLPYLPSTHHIINKERFDMMKEHAVIVCTARGNIIDEDDLYDALKSGRIGGAGLDVFAQEPLPTDSRLFELENCILTPHVSSQTYESLWNIYKKAIDIMDAFYRGEPLGRGDLVNPDYAK